MGIQLTSLVDGEEIEMEALFDKTVAVDAYNWLYQFLTTIRQPDGQPLRDSQGRVTSHLSGLFYRNIKLIEAGLRPVYVFDGEPPELKKRTAEKRRGVRDEAKREWKKALKRRDYEEARKQAVRSTRITDAEIRSAQSLLKRMGIPAIQAPSEGEALCAVMARKGDAYCVATQDYDSLLFGTPRLVRNLSITGKKKRGDSYITIKPEMLKLGDVLEKMKISREQLIMLGILVGTDYNPGGVSGLGPKKSLDLVKEKKDFGSIFADVEWDFDAQPDEIYEFFLNPPPGDYDVRFEQPEEDGIRSFLCGEHDFSEERVNSALKRLKKKGDQSSLSRWTK